MLSNEYKEASIPVGKENFGVVDSSVAFMIRTKKSQAARPTFSSRCGCPDPDITDFVI